MAENNQNNGKRFRIPILIEVAILLAVSCSAVFLEVFFNLHQKFENFADHLNLNPFHLDIGGVFVISLILYLLTSYIRKVRQVENALKVSRQLEGEVEKSRDDLEERVQRRTVELARTNVDLNDEIVEHKKTEESLRLSEGRYRFLIESLPQSIFLKSRSCVYISCNDNFARDVGIRLQDVAGKTDFDFFPKDLAEKYRQDDERIMEQAQPEEFNEHYTHNGRDVTVHTVKNPIKDDSGKVIGIIGIFWDVTEIKRKEAEIVNLQKRIEFILGATKTGLDIIDSDYNLVYIDPEWAKIYGDPNGKSCFKYFMDRGSVCPGCGVKKALETKQMVVTEEILAKEGNRPIQIITLPYQDEKGKWLVAEVNIDMTERKRIEAALKANQEHLEELVNQRTEALKITETRYRRLFEAARDGILILNAENGQIDDANPFMVEMLGYSKERIFR
ncbi:MAG: PAS domain-containing protein [Candidatus Omnitrophica bacterium]|nr:PAS domain-containing protein [Candidatus Omnitrophota bacterium]